MENADDRMARKKRIKEETVVAGDYKQIWNKADTWNLMIAFI